MFVNVPQDYLERFENVEGFVKEKMIPAIDQLPIPSLSGLPFHLYYCKYSICVWEFGAELRDDILSSSNPLK